METESPIKMVLDMITPPPDADMDEEESNVPAAEDKIKPKNKSENSAKNGKPTTPARKKIGIEKKCDKKTESLKTTVRKCSLTKETPVPKENTNSSKPNTPSKRATGVGYDGRPLLVVKMSSTTTKPIAAPRRNSMPATSKSVPVPSARKVSANTPSNPTTPKRTVSKQTTSTTKPTTASTRASATSKPTTTKPLIATSKTDKPTAKPTSAAPKSTDTKATAKHKGVPFLPKKITSSASSISERSSTTTTKSVPTTTSSKQPLSKPTTNGSKPTTNGSKRTTNGTKPMTNGTKPMTNGTKPTSNGTRPTTNCTKPTEKIEKSTLKSSNMITITNGRTVGKKASITDDKTDSIS